MKQQTNLYIIVGTTLTLWFVSSLAADPQSIGRPKAGDNDVLLGKRTFEFTCAACHGPGISGAPSLRDRNAWAPRLRQGKQTLIQHAVTGYGYMPAKGGNALLNDKEVAAAVEYMLNRLK